MNTGIRIRNPALRRTFIINKLPYIAQITGIRQKIWLLLLFMSGVPAIVSFSAVVGVPALLAIPAVGTIPCGFTAVGVT
jgi:hypothetical protein